MATGVLTVSFFSQETMGQANKDRICTVGDSDFRGDCRSDWRVLFDPLVSATTAV